MCSLEHGESVEFYKKNSICWKKSNLLKIFWKTILENSTGQILLIIVLMVGLRLDN